MRDMTKYMDWTLVLRIHAGMEGSAIQFGLNAEIVTGN